MAALRGPSRAQHFRLSKARHLRVADKPAPNSTRTFLTARQPQRVESSIDQLQSRQLFISVQAATSDGLMAQY